MKRHPVFARVYEVLSRAAERAGEWKRRQELGGGALGRVLEVGVGNGLNLRYYRAADAVVALDPDPTMLSLSRPRAARAPARVALVRGAAEALPFPDAVFDTVVASLVLCSVADPGRAAAEMWRVLRPGGELRLLEHVRSPARGWTAVQDAVAPAWALLAGGCRPNRDTVGTLRAAGFRPVGRRFPFGPLSPCRPHVLAVATKEPPAAGEPPRVGDPPEVGDPA